MSLLIFVTLNTFPTASYTQPWWLTDTICHYFWMLVYLFHHMLKKEACFKKKKKVKFSWCTRTESLETDGNLPSKSL